jgi:hypothetical protein
MVFCFAFLAYLYVIGPFDLDTFSSYICQKPMGRIIVQSEFCNLIL